MSVAESHHVEGHVSRGFEAMREAFAVNFAQRGELGGACCAYHRGEKVVDLWGGIRDQQTGEPWEPDTMVIVYSTTKGVYRDDACNRPLPGMARLRRTGMHVLAGVREDIPDSRLATITRPTWVDGFPLRLALDTMNPRSKIVRALRGFRAAS